MPVRYLLDTNICIYIQREKPEEVLARFEQLQPGDAAISVITWGELLYGAEESRQRKRTMELLEEFRSFVPVLPMPESAGSTYGAIRASLESKGRPIGNNDLWIAAHAKEANLTIVTNNEREFQRVPGLKVQNWV
ncbi:MAG: type II toxin-antitoxin system VapC family toxin [Deltaproteobacteria bacterium]|nr:type II toxin-antitoxin system VapC family toxin [Deltaproteobacteria bacterium]